MFIRKSIMTSSCPISTSKRSGAVSLSVLALAACLSLGVSQTADAKTHTKTPTLREQIRAETQQMLDAQKAQFDAAEAQKQAQIDALQAQVNSLTGELQATKAQVAAVPAPPTVAQITPQVVAALPKPDTTVAMKKGTVSFASSDGAFTLAIHGVMQLDAAS
jgi:phosphate-selective porin OprO/OprP